MRTQIFNAQNSTTNGGTSKLHLPKECIPLNIKENQLYNKSPINQTSFTKGVEYAETR